MIDSLNEELLSLTEAAKFLPGRRQSKRPTLSCLYRWTKQGCRGIVLESIQVGGTRCTSRQAIARFIQHLSNPNSTAGHRVPNSSRSHHADVERKLDGFDV